QAAEDRERCPPGPARDRRRPHADQAGRAQSDVQRDQVHRRRQDHGPGPPRRRDGARVGSGYRHRDLQRGPGEAVRALPAPRQSPRAAGGRHRSGPGHQQEIHRAASRPHLGREPREPWLDVSFHAAASRGGRLGDFMPSAIRKDGSRPKILHVEDNPENRMRVGAILEAEGYTISGGEDGWAGIEAAIREEPALILLDVNLPAVDGYEVVSIIKSFPAFATTPVIAVTAYAMEGDRQRTLVAGCDGYIQKPIDVDTFPRQGAEFLHGKREQVEEREQGVDPRELNQRLVYRLVNQVEELKRLNQHFVRRAAQLADLHRAVQDITSELGVEAMLQQLLPNLAGALGTTYLAIDIV